MSRYTGPQWKISRRLDFSTLENGKEFAVGKNGKDRRRSIPGQHGGMRRRKQSEYGIQLQEKQRIRYTYGLSEKQLHKLFVEAGKMKGPRGDNFMIMLESRLDNVVYRLGFASTRRQARQLVNHQHITVDGRKVDIPSYIVKPGQVISVRDKSKNLAIIKEALEATLNRREFLAYDEKKMEGTFVRRPERSECLEGIEDTLVVEFYNR